MIVDTIACLLLIVGVALGLSRPLIDRMRVTPAEGLVAGAALSLVGAWAVAWGIFTTGCPLSAYWLIPGLAAAGLLVGRGGVRRLGEDPAARDLMVGQLIITIWCVALLAFVRAHSGGAWMGDFVEHWERAQFFVRQWPPERLFFDIYQLPARPPLSNVLTAAFMRMTSVDYAHFQVIMTVLCSLAYLPVGLLAGRFGGRAATRAAVVFLMANPLFAQNATYPWTKLHSVFFILTGLYFFLRMRDADAGDATAANLCALCLGGAVVTHYSSGPYVIVFVAAWVALGFSRRWNGGFGRLTVHASVVGACVVAPWLGWSLGHYGWHATVLSNTSVSMLQKAHGNPWVTMLLNLRDSIVPPQVRGFAGNLFRQTSPWGGLRDQCFLVYQLNPVLALGSVGWIVVTREAARAARDQKGREGRHWCAALAGVVLLSFATYADRDHYGIGHICLQSLVLLGLAFLASRWEGLSPGWRRALVIGGLVDFCLGIGLQFAVEDFALGRGTGPSPSLLETARTYSLVSQENLREKIIARMPYFADILATPPALVLALLGALLCTALMRARPTPGETR